MFCISCGRDNLDGVNYCLTCGTPLALYPETLIICNKCGEGNYSSQKYCFSCGTKIPKKKVCLGCGYSTPEDVTFCIMCGTKLSLMEKSKTSPPVVASGTKADTSTGNFSSDSVGSTLSGPSVSGMMSLAPSGGETGTDQDPFTFISYAREDEGFVEKLASDLKDKGVRVWVDQFDIHTGDNWDQKIDEALYGCSQFLIVLSPRAVASSEVRGELHTALAEGKRIVPVLYQACRIPRQLRAVQHIDFSSSEMTREESLQQLVRDLLDKK